MNAESDHRKASQVLCWQHCSPQGGMSPWQERLSSWKEMQEAVHCCSARCTHTGACTDLLPALPWEESWAAGSLWCSEHLGTVCNTFIPFPHLLWGAGLCWGSHLQSSPPACWARPCPALGANAQTHRSIRKILITLHCISSFFVKK